MKRRKPKAVRVPREWYHLLPGQSLAFWVRVEIVRKKKGVRKKDWDGVKEIANGLLIGTIDFAKYQ